MKNKCIFDTEGFAHFFKLSYESIYRLILRYIPDPESARDITQDTFVKIYERRADFETQEHAKAYSYITAKNLSLDYIKHQKVEHNFAAEKREIQTDVNSFLKHITYEETIQLVKKAIAILSKRSQQIILMNMAGSTNEQIAQELHISVNTVKTLKKRAYAKLREVLASHYSSLIVTLLLLLISTRFFIS